MKRGFSRQLDLDIVYVDNSEQTKKSKFVNLFLMANIV